MKWKVDSRVDDRVCSAVKESEWDWIDLVGVELMLGDSRGVQETMG